MSTRVTESQLVDPVLKLIACHGDDEGGLDITKIDELLRQSLELTETDKEILKGRKDDKFSQVVRNLVSHRTLEKKGYAIYKNNGTYRRGAYYLTQEGASIAEVPFKPQQPDLFE